MIHCCSRISQLWLIIVLLIGFLLGPSAWAQDDGVTEPLPIPDFFVDIQIHPENPTIHDYIHLSGEIAVNAPLSGFSYNQRVDQDGNVLFSVDMDDEIATEGRFLHQHIELSLGKLNAGEYSIIVNMNGAEQRKINYAVIEAPERPTPTPNPINSIVQDVHLESGEMIANQPLQFFVQGMFTNAGTKIEGGIVSIEDHTIRLDLKVTPSDALSRMLEPFEYKFDVKPLPVGEYIAVLYINDMIATRIPVNIHDPISKPTPSPWPFPEIPIEELSMFHDPSRILVDQPILYYVSGWFHTSDTKIIDKNATIMDDGTIQLDLTVEPGPEGPEVLTYFEEVFEIGPLPAGEYYTILNINDVTVQKQHFGVWQGMPTHPPIDPEPQVPIYEIDFAILPTVPQPDEKFQILVEGLLPTGETQVKYPFVEYVNEEIWLNVQIENWDTGPEVLTKFEQTFDIGTLSEGYHTVKFYANGELHAQTQFSVGDPLDPKLLGPHCSYFVIDKDLPTPGEPIPVLFKATFPTAGFDVTPLELYIEDQTVIAEVQFTEPDEPVAQVITPAEIKMGELTLNAGVYVLQGIVNDVKLTPQRFIVQDVSGDDSLLLKFTREGGLAGTNSWVELYQNGIFLRKNELSSNTVVQHGTVPDELWGKLFDLVNRLDFESMPEIFEPDIPIADGFTYSLSYESHSIKVIESAEIPEELSETIQILNEILINLSATDTLPRLVDDEESYIQNWKDF